MQGQAGKRHQPQLHQCSGCGVVRAAQRSILKCSHPMSMPCPCPDPFGARYAVQQARKVGPHACKHATQLPQMLPGSCLACVPDIFACICASRSFTQQYLRQGKRTRHSGGKVGHDRCCSCTARLIKCRLLHLSGRQGSAAPTSTSTLTCEDNSSSGGKGWSFAGWLVRRCAEVGCMQLATRGTCRSKGTPA